MGIPERLREILRKNAVSERELSRQAGLADSHVGLLLVRLKRDPYAVHLRTLAQIAKAGEVPLLWLLGVGDDAVRPSASLTRDAGAALAEDEGVWIEAIRSVLARDVSVEDVNRSPEWWLLQFKAREIEMIDEAAKRARGRTTPAKAPRAPKKR